MAWNLFDDGPVDMDKKTNLSSNHIPHAMSLCAWHGVTVYVLFANKVGTSRFSMSYLLVMLVNSRGIGGGGGFERTPFSVA